MRQREAKSSGIQVAGFAVAAGILMALCFAGTPVSAQSAGQATTAAGTASAQKQEPNASSAPRPAPRTPDGKPDFSGIWNGPTVFLNTDLGGGQLPFTAAGQVAYQSNLTKATDPEALCILVGEPRANLDGEPFEIFQTAKRIGFLYERNDSWRQVALDRNDHPKEPEPSFFGDAVGTWEGDTLVVDVIGIKGFKIWSDNVGHPQSEALHMVERWTRPDMDHLQVELTLTDPKYYSKPIKVTKKLVRQHYDLIENSCDEKHVREHPGFGVEAKE